MTDGCDSFTRDCRSFSHLGFRSESTDGIDSVSAMLSSATLSMLSLPKEADATSKSDKRSKMQTGPAKVIRGLDAEHVESDIDSEIDSVDFSWLRERCGDDDNMVLEVLMAFVRQGQDHVKSLCAVYSKNTDASSKAQGVMYHAVCMISTL